MSRKKSFSKKSTKISPRVRNIRSKDATKELYDSTKVAEAFVINETDAHNLIVRMNEAKTKEDAINVLNFGLSILPNAEKIVVLSDKKTKEPVIYFIHRKYKGRTVGYDIPNNVMFFLKEENMFKYAILEGLVK